MPSACSVAAASGVKWAAFTTGTGRAAGLELTAVGGTVTTPRGRTLATGFEAALGAAFKATGWATGLLGAEVRAIATGTGSETVATRCEAVTTTVRALSGAIARACIKTGGCGRALLVAPGWALTTELRTLATELGAWATVVAIG
jgi:hypothetical protein